MTVLGMAGAFLLVLAVIFLFGNLWFHLVEAVLGWIKGKFARRGEPPAWHVLPPDEGDEKDGRPRR